MARQHWTRSLALALSLLFILQAAPAAWAQNDKNKKKNQDGQDVPDRERTVKKERTDIFKKWMEQDVVYIITSDEKRAFKKLATDEEREQYIEAFWRRRDPNPDTEVNEYLEEHFERIAYANQHFASGIPGWKTDRGRIYIMYGPPHDKESHPMGGQYDRPSYHGGGSTTTYPFEVWFYRHLPGVGSGVEIEFVDPTGTGEYRIARSPNEKDALLHIPGAGMTLGEQLGMSDKADRVASAGGFGYTGPGARVQDSPFEWLQRVVDLQRPPQINEAMEKNLLALVNSPVEDPNSLDVDARVDFFRQSDNSVITAITVQADNRDLKFNDIGGVQTARLNIYGRVTSVAGRRVTSFEDPVVDHRHGRGADRRARAQVRLPARRAAPAGHLQGRPRGARHQLRLAADQARRLHRAEVRGRQALGLDDGARRPFADPQGSAPRHVHHRPAQGDPERRGRLQARAGRGHLHADLQRGR